MTAQRALLALAVVAGAVSGLLYYAGAQRVGVVAAATDLSAAREIAAADVEMRELPPDAVPADAIRDVARAIGRFPKGPVWRGQLMVAGAIADEPAGISSGVAIPAGMHALAIPVGIPAALGGAIAPGARVDVIAVPLQGRAPDDRTTELLVASALVIDVRGENGGDLDRRNATQQPAGAIRERIGSVLIAVGPAQELLVADRTANSSFVLALVPRR